MGAEKRRWSFSPTATTWKRTLCPRLGRGRQPSACTPLAISASQSTCSSQSRTDEGRSHRRAKAKGDRPNH